VDASRERTTQLAAILAALGASAFYVVLATGTAPAQNQDFLNLYTGGMLARTGHLADLYDFDVQVRQQERIAPGVRPHFPFVRPPFYAVALSPISLLPFHQAYCAWIALQILLLLCVWAWSWRRFGPESIIYCSLFSPAALGIAHGQDCVVLTLIGMGALVAAERRQDKAAGSLFALALCKFHLFLLIPFAIALRRRWAMLAGYAVTAAILAFGSFALAGTAGIRGYVALLTRRDLATLAPSPGRMLGVRAMAVNFGADWLWLEAGIAILVVAASLWPAYGERDEWRWIAAAVLGSLLLSPHTYGYDAAVLLPFAVAAVYLGTERGTRAAAATALLPLTYLPVLAGPPWAALPSFVLLAFLAALVSRSFVERLHPAKLSLSEAQYTPSTTVVWNPRKGRTLRTPSQG
jgi:hypothetical protein